MKYKKKPVVIDAIQWDGDNIVDVIKFLNNKSFTYEYSTGLIIHTLEGNHYASIGDFIIKGIAGEFYPCKPDIFYMTYEIAE